MAITAVAAIAGAGAVATGVVAVETLAIAAAVTSVVGVVTKSKELTRIGTGMALGAAGAGLLGLGTGAAAGAAGATVDAGAEAAGSTGLAGSDLAGASAGSAGAAAGGAGDAAAGGANAALAGGAAPLDASLAGAPSTGIIGSAAAPTTSAAGTTAAADAGAAAADGVAGAVGPAGAVAPAGPMAVNAPAAPWSPAAGGVDGAIKAAAASTNPADFAGMADSSSFFGDGVMGKVGTWVGNNKMLASSLLSLGGGLAQGVSGAYAADRNYQTQQDYLKLAQQQAANGSAQPRINMTVNPNANVFGTQSKTYNGIIAGARGG